MSELSSKNVRELGFPGSQVPDVLQVCLTSKSLLGGWMCGWGAISGNNTICKSKMKPRLATTEAFKVVIGVIATLGPTWEFKLCLKSCKLASWTTMWL